MLLSQPLFAIWVWLRYKIAPTIYIDMIDQTYNPESIKCDVVMMLLDELLPLLPGAVSEEVGEHCFTLGPHLKHKHGFIIKPLPIRLVNNKIHVHYQ